MRVKGKLIVITLALSVALIANGEAPGTSAASQVPVPTRSVDARGTEQQPFLVSQPSADIARAEMRQAEHSRNERMMTNATFALAGITFVLAVFTALLWYANKRLVAQTARDTLASIKQATRSADAMQSVAEATRSNAALMEDILHKQMRAYVAVDTGNTVYQDGRLRFGSSPSLLNTGFTPAKNLRYRVSAAILDFPLPSDYKFSDSAKLSEYDVALSPRQNFTISGVVASRYEEPEVEAIMKGEKKRLFVWGTVAYDDVFGGRWETQFCHHFNWFRAGDKDEWRIGKFYHTTHNSMT
jgi:hypothetical protein